MTKAAITRTRKTMKMIHHHHRRHRHRHHHHHHHHHLETITHTIQNEEPGDSDLHTYSDNNNVSTDWRNKINHL